MNIELEIKMKENEEDFEVEQMNQKSREALAEVEQHKVLFSEESSVLYSSTRLEANYDYDYEVNNVRFAEEDDDEYIYMKKNSRLLGMKYEKVDPSTELYDSLNIPYYGDQKILNPFNTTIKAKANIFKRLVSKKKRRLQTEYYDLDMCYITERVIGMGFPATGCEKLYRNTLEDTKNFLDRYHGDYKIYNLCIEKDRIYPKTYFENTEVGLFPFNDHSPCPCKLILDFCVDICLYLTAHPRGVAAIHCKAGKGRTGVMIVCYLIFSGLCKTSDEALVHYAHQRTLNNRGVTIPSQIRYIKYFETFLCSNYEKPFLKCIPKIIKYDLNKKYTNMIINYNVDMSYFTTINSFRLKSCIIGPFHQEMNLTHQFSAITRKKLNFLRSEIRGELRKDGWYYIIDINTDEVINYDLKLNITSKNLSFYSWFNLWYATFEIVSKYVIENHYFEEGTIHNSTDTNINKALTETNIKVPEKKIDNSINTNTNNINIINTNNTDFTENSEKSQFLNIISTNKKSKGPSVMAITLAKMKLKTKKKNLQKKKSALLTLKNNKDLNNIIDGIDDLAKGINVPLINRKSLVFVIERKELDKLKTKINDNFSVKYIYELLK